MKKKKITLISVVLLAICFGCAVYKADSIYYRIASIKTKVVANKEYTYRNSKNDIDLSQYDRISLPVDDWYNQYSVISHSGGV